MSRRKATPAQGSDWRAASGLFATGNAGGDARQPVWVQARRPVMLNASIAAAGLACLGVVFVVLNLHTGLWAPPAFLPLYLWLGAWTVSGAALRPGVLCRLSVGGRAIGITLMLLLLWLVWSLWAAHAALAWEMAGGRLWPSISEFGAALSVDGPHFPYGHVIDSAPLLLGVVWFLLVALGMLAMPGNPLGTRPPQYASQLAGGKQGRQS